MLSYYNNNGKRRVKYFSTGLPEKGNKRKAEAELARIRSEFVPPQEVGELASDMPFADYLLEWLDIVKVRVKATTFSSYEQMVKSVIEPYFRKKAVTLQGLEARHIQQFYSEKLKTVKPNSVIHYHAVIHQALKYATKTDLVTQNVAMKVDRPKKNDYQPVFLDAEELQHLFEVVKWTKLELPVLVAAFYGLRRGEVCGLKWDAIDFERGTITIRHTVTSLQLDGKTKIYAQDSAKTKSSMRTLPLVGSFAEYFKEVKAAQEVNKKVCGNCYNYEYDGYVFVDELGDLMRPEYLTSYFPQYIQKHGCKRMRFHDLRHSCASLLLANGVPLKQIQEWLGHSDFSTTANIYAHLDYTSKLSSAKAMVSGMALPESVNFSSKWTKFQTMAERTDFYGSNTPKCPKSPCSFQKTSCSFHSFEPILSKRVKKKSPANPLVYWTFWRRVRDSNPRDLSVYSISSAAPSTTRTTLRVYFRPVFFPEICSKIRWRENRRDGKKYSILRFSVLRNIKENQGDEILSFCRNFESVPL